jgi:arsenical pump membrane protein
VHETVDTGAIRAGAPVVAFLLIGFTVGDALGVPAWVVAALALAWLCARTRSLPWRHVPAQAVALALALGTLALGAAQSIDVGRVLTVAGLPGEALAFGATALGVNAVNNLPAVLVALPALELHPERVWAVLLAANLGPTLWVTGALSTLLWQSTMARLGHPVPATRYAAVGVRVGVPVLAAALAAHLVITVLT